MGYTQMHVCGWRMDLSHIEATDVIFAFEDNHDRLADFPRSFRVVHDLLLCMGIISNNHSSTTSNKRTQG